MEKLKVHIECPGQDNEWAKTISTLKMLCGVSVLVNDDGNTEPEDFDFYPPLNRGPAMQTINTGQSKNSERIGSCDKP